MPESTPQLDALLDLEARHESLLESLADLDQRVERVLAEYLPKRGSPLGDLDSPARAD